MPIWVRNVEGSSKKPPKPECGCEDWIDHWKRNQTKHFGNATCMAIGRLEPHDKELVGAHVWKRGDAAEQYIVPLCKTHNMIDPEKWFEVDDAASPVSTRKQLPCHVPEER